MLFFTSDLHLDHASAIEFKNRPFLDVEEMNRALIDNINKTVLPNDELWILGDFSYRVNKEQIQCLREKIECKHVHLVYGNHDKDYSQDHIFQSVQHYKELKTEYGLIILFHYPILEWKSAHYGSIHLHGHIHSTGEYNSDNLKRRFADRFPLGHTPQHEGLGLRVYDVGVDANNFLPISLAQIAQKMDILPVHSQLN